MLVWAILNRNTDPIASIAIDEPELGVYFSPTIFLAKVDEKIKLWYLPQKDHLFSFDQTLYLLALNRAFENTDTLSKQQMQELIKTLKASLDELFDNPWIKNHIRTLIGVFEFKAAFALKAGFTIEDLDAATQALLSPPPNISEDQLEIYKGTLITFINMKLIYTKSKDERKILENLLEKIPQNLQEES